MTRQATLILATLAVLCWGLPAVHVAENKVIWLDEMNLSHAMSGHGGCQPKRTVDNKPLTLWLDRNGDFCGACENLAEQKEGKVVWPSIE